MTPMRRTLLAALAALVAGCTGAPAQLGTTAAMAPTNVDFSHGREIHAEACGFQLFLFIPISINSRAQRANEQLVAEAGGDYITDVKVSERWTYGFVGTSYCTQLSAMAYPRKS